MKTFIIYCMLSALSSMVCGQIYQDGKEYQTENNMYRCHVTSTESFRNSFRNQGVEPTWSKGPSYYWYAFTNTQNVLEGTPTGVRGIDNPGVNSERKLLELLCEVYGGKEKIKSMGSERISFRFYFGMDLKVKELKITVSSEYEDIKTTVLQLETIENLVKERIYGIFNHESPQYRDAIYTIYSGGYMYPISQISEILETGEYDDLIYGMRRKIDGGFISRLKEISK